jgi:hypothetical protein
MVTSSGSSQFQATTVSSHYGISPIGRTTWGIAVVRDEAWTETSPVFVGGIKGDWPPFFDALPDLAKGQK